MTSAIIALWLLGAVPSVALAELSRDTRGFAVSLAIIIAVWPVLAFFGFIKGAARWFS